ncbi:MAG: AAA family ATPase [Acetobacteraceae bacterium]|nr:AAA family ATPase [Acetobacteraceae bacterium]
MKLRALEIEQVRKFGGPVRLGEFADGINVLCGPNEFGKSTLLAAIRGVLFERYASKAESVRRMGHARGGSSPRIALTFDTGRGRHRIEKRFLHREPYARLTLPDGHRIEGDHAEEALQALLGFRAAKQGAKPEDAGVWSALWVTQRSSVEQPDWSSEPARTTLQACLEAEIGAVTGGERGQGILREVLDGLALLQDKRGQPKGRLKEVDDLLASADADLLRLADKHRALASDIAELQRCGRMLAHINDADEAAKLDADLANARSRRDAVLRYEDAYRQAEMALRLAEAAHAALAAEAARRGQRRRDLHTARLLAERIAEADAAARTALAAADAEAGTAGATLCAAERAADAASGRLRQARRDAELAAKAGELAAATERLVQAEAAQARVNELSGERASFGADGDGMAAMREAALGLAHARAVLDAQATSVLLDLQPEAQGRVLVDGAPAPSELRAVAEVALDIAGIGRILIRPAIRDRDALLSDIAAAERRLAAALGAIGATDERDAERRHVQRVQCERRLDDARRDLAMHAPGDPARGLAAGAGALRNHVAVLRRQLEHELAERGMPAPPPPTDAEADMRAALAADAEASAALGPARAAVACCRERTDRCAREAARTAAERRTAEAEAGRLQREIAEVTSGESDAALACRETEAARDVLAKRDARALVERARPEDTLAGMDARITRLEQAIGGRRETLQKLQRESAVRQSRIEQEEASGLAEQIAALESRREELARERALLLREVAVLELLRDTLGEAERAAKERYLAPITRRLTPYLQGLFPSASVQCDETFRISGVLRDGAASEDFSRLSDGTQEQIAILSRLAFADMLMEGGRPAMIILDDALAFADRDRMERMFDLLTEAARRVQILVLTCRADVFDRLGGHRLTLEEMAGRDAAPGNGRPALPQLF